MPISLFQNFHAFSTTYLLTGSVVFLGVDELILALTLCMRSSIFVISSLYLFIVGFTVVSFVLLIAYELISLYLSNTISGSYNDYIFLTSFMFLILYIFVFAAVSISFSRLFSSLSNILLYLRVDFCSLSFEYFFYISYRIVMKSINCFG